MTYRDRIDTPRIKTSASRNLTGNLATAKIKLFNEGVTTSQIRGLVDTGAQLNLITFDCVKRLNLSVSPANKNVIGIGGSQVILGTTSAYLCAKNGENLGFASEFNIVSNIMHNVPSTITRKFAKGYIDDADLADDLYYLPASIDVVLGVGVCARIFDDDIMQLDDGLIALGSKLGWIVLGERDEEEYLECQLQQSTGDIDLDLALRKLWEVDQVESTTAELTPDELWCERNFAETCYRDNDGRYVTTISIKSTSPALGQSRERALQRFYSLERRLKRDPQLAEKYITFMREYEALGHMKLADRPIIPERPHFYIPHHPIQKKFRVVFDASAKTTNNQSLNDLQLPGPKVQPALYDTILRFRSGKIAITADIEKMFRQVRVVEDQWDLQRILWREDPRDDLKEYWLTVITYGLTSAGYNAVKAMLKCAADNANDFPMAAKLVPRCFYMDDLLLSVNTLEEAKEAYWQVKGSLGAGGFKLTKWSSNMPATIENASTAPVGIEEKQNISLLGLVWDPTADELCFKVLLEPLTGVSTKRTVASQGAKIFDPNGYITPITIQAKIFMQNLWRIGVQWDEPLSPDVVKTWQTYYDSLLELGEFKIPRWTGIAPDAAVQIHTFCDASIKAYGAVVYVRCEYPNQTVRVTLLTSKSKVADLRSVSVPRLELCAAKLAAELTVTVVRCLEIPNTEVYYWTDSEIVLFWLRKFPSDLKTFVGNRVSAIQACSRVKRWRHVSSKSNPADLISRGVSVGKLKTMKSWWNGPSFLCEPSSRWPVWEKADPSPDDMKTLDGESRKKMDGVMLLVTRGVDESVFITLLERFSSLSKAVRTTAYVMRFISRTRSKERTRRMIAKRGSSETGGAIARVDPISVEEYTCALTYWVKFTQRVHYANEVQRMGNNMPLQKSSKIYSFVPFLDNNGVLRMRGRIERASLTFDERHPILLPSNCTLAQRLMAEAHQTTLHGGCQLCMQYLRERYWITGLRSSMRKYIRACVKCAIQRREMSSQLMADLPEPRVTPHRPFTHCGVDYAGPFKLKPYKNARGSKIQVMAYVAVFVCFSSKAVHLELVGDLSTQAFLGALDRMIVRKNHVEHLYSDNGRNFVGAANELERVYQVWQSTDVINELTVKGITWHFNTPLAPHHGGLWEAAVKSFKRHLKTVAGEVVFTFEELSTLLVRVEAALNSRPIASPSDDPMDLTIITPGHLLTGHQILKPLGPHPSHSAKPNNLSWEKIRSIERDLWRRWSSDYLVQLQRRTKWINPKESIKVGALVIIKDEEMPAGHWKRGRIVEVFPGRDGLVRSVLVRTATSEYQRPITRLCVLPVEPREEDNHHSDPMEGNATGDLS